MRLRDVQLGDVDTYVRMRCDPVMMAELGGPLPRDGIEAKVRRDVEDATADRAWIQMILVDGNTVAGNVVLWAHDPTSPGEQPMSEIGWMVLPEHQGRGVAKAAVRMLLRRARDERRWGIVHAFPGVANGPSNGICRSLGFTLIGEQDTEFAGRVLRTRHWQIDPSAEETAHRDKGGER
ncbi:MAG TPA: GNAT family N-acetyltransferase [Pseudonocardiaceae bacterium]|nr:GNAT family N-acetyltransferase [Pseudonocardiaceae bacterium]